MDKKERILREHASFRISTSTLDNLRKISKEQKVSLNTYVNQIIDSHLSWDLYAPEVGWVIMLKSALKELIKNVDPETISSIARNVAETGGKEIALSMRGKYGIDEWISILKDRAKSSGFSIKEYDGEDRVRLVMYHGLGENWSVFFENYYYAIFYDLGSDVKTEHTENSVLLEIKRKIDPKRALGKL